MNKKILSMAFLVCSALNYSKAATNFNNQQIDKAQNTSKNMDYQNLRKDLTKNLTPVFNNNKNQFTLDERVKDMFVNRIIDCVTHGDGTFMPEHMQNITPQEVFSSQYKYSRFVLQIKLYFRKILKNNIILPNFYCCNMKHIKTLLGELDMKEMIDQVAFNFNFVTSYHKYNIFFKRVDEGRVIEFFDTLKNICDLEKKPKDKVNFLPPMQEVYNSKGILGVKEALVKGFYTQELIDSRKSDFMEVDGELVKIVYKQNLNDQTGTIKIQGLQNLEKFYNKMLLNVFSIFCADKNLQILAERGYGEDYEAEFWLQSGDLLQMHISLCNNNILYRVLKENNIQSVHDAKFLVLLNQRKKILGIFDRIFVDFIAQTYGVDKGSIEFFDYSTLTEITSSFNKFQILQNITNKKQAIYSFLDLVFFNNKYLTHPTYAQFAIQIKEAFKKISTDLF